VVSHFQDTIPIPKDNGEDLDSGLCNACTNVRPYVPLGRHTLPSRDVKGKQTKEPKD